MKTSNFFGQEAAELSPRLHTQGFVGEQLMVTRVTFEAGGVGALHSHPHEQMTIVLSGEVEFTLGDESKIIKTGDAVSIPGNMVHGAKALTEAILLDIFNPVREDIAQKLGLL
jgi:quercetin dioxygenase-like cupin family protein